MFVFVLRCLCGPSPVPSGRGPSPVHSYFPFQSSWRGRVRTEVWGPGLLEEDYTDWIWSVPIFVVSVFLQMFRVLMLDCTAVRVRWTLQTSSLSSFPVLFSLPFVRFTLIRFFTRNAPVGLPWSIERGSVYSLHPSLSEFTERVSVTFSTFSRWLSVYTEIPTPVVIFATDGSRSPPSPPTGLDLGSLALKLSRHF